MLVSDLIADQALHLELATPSTAAELGREIHAVATTESLSPAGFIQPNTLVLTTGIGMNFENAQIWEGYVERLMEADVSAVAFGVGQAHKKLPAGLADAACQAGLPILVVPLDVSFLQLQQNITQTLAGERYWLSRKAWALASQCIAVASRQGGLDEMLKLIQSHTNLPVAIVDEAGRFFAGSRDVGQRPARLEIAIGGEATWELLMGTDVSEDFRILYSPVATAVSMALSRDFETKHENDSALVKALLDNSAEAPGRLNDLIVAHKIDLGRGVVLMKIDARNAVRRSLLAHRLRTSLFSELRHVEFVYQASSYVIVEADRDSDVGKWRAASANLIHPQLGDCLRISELIAELDVLLLGFRVMIAAQGGTGVLAADTIQLKGIVQLIPLPLRSAMVKSILHPVFDDPQFGRYKEVLRAALTTRSHAEAAAFLGVHRNTYHKEKQRLEQALGIDLDCSKDIAKCALVLEAMG